MQRSTAEKLRENWGNAFCFHPIFDKEYKSSEHTGNYVCLICGKVLSEEDYKLFEEAKQTSQKLLS